MYPITDKSYTSQNTLQNVFIIIFLTLGVGIRLFHFFYNRSLWMDEVYLSTSIVKMNLGDLIRKPLYYQQKAPIGFLISVKLITNTFGNKEIFLRLIPLVSGILSMFLFVPISKYFFKGLTSVLAICILCLSPAIIYHSVEIKQYSTELLGTVLSLFLYIKFKNKDDIKNLFIWGLCGAIILWFSYSSIFILAGIGIGLTIGHTYTSTWKALLARLIPFSIWIISFIVNYLLFTHKHAESEWIVYWFRAYNNFMPFPPKSFADLKWFALNIYRMMDYPLGLLWNFNNIKSNQLLSVILKEPFLPIILLGLGTYLSIKKRRNYSAIFIVSVFLTFLASGLELYPLTERFWVFLSPIFIIFIAEGFSFALSKLKQRNLKYLLFLILIAGPLIQSISTIIYPETFYLHKKSFERETLSYVNKNFKTGDAVYVYWNNLPGYKLYKEIYNLKYKAIEGTDKRLNSKNYTEYYKHLEPDFKKFSKNKRVWLIFNKQFVTDIGDRIDEPRWYYEKHMNPTAHLTHEFSKKFNILKKYETKDVAAYLFTVK